MASTLEQEELRLHQLRNMREVSSQRRADLFRAHARRQASLVKIEALLQASELEHERWSRRAERFRVQLEELPGSLVLLAMYVSCATALPLQQRQELLEQWALSAAEKGVTLPAPCEARELLADFMPEDCSPDQTPSVSSDGEHDGVASGGPSPLLVSLVRVCHGTQWAMHYVHSEAFPRDDSPRAAALAMALGSRWRWPLLLDPQLVARRWLQQ